jgi:putative membrane protein
MAETLNLEKMRTKFFIGLLATSLLITAACEQRRDPVEEAHDVNIERETVERQDSDVLTDAASTNMMSMELSRIASERAVTPEAKELAQELSDYSQTVNQEIQSIAQNKQIALPQDLSPNHRDKVQDVSEKQGIDFDKEFVDQVIDAYKDKVDDFESLSRDSDDPEIREFAIRTLPNLRMTLEKAERAEEIISERDNGRTGDMFGTDDDTYDDDSRARDRDMREGETDDRDI